ncbi:uncharacterized protein LOC115877347 [Sitophilus oryzae]|uniref:Uncharacterized protein LOC115877347 n=1 Tax=Sitophilus oryzae TaxID=7048 RepID=A0A6J2XDX9_SITOR|nr:uncharacterized protein LOC115877347 [Sitophilus oryzae]
MSHQLSKRTPCSALAQPNHQLKNKIRKLRKVVKSLEFSLTESLGQDRRLLFEVRSDSLKMSGLRHRLEEVMHENEQLLDKSQARASGTSLGVSTMSLVHLQYKYDELAQTHDTLLQLLESRNAEIKRFEQLNNTLQERIRNLTLDLENSLEKVGNLERKLAEVKRRKREKISRFKKERQALGVIHNRLIAVLHRQCMEKNEFINVQLKLAQDSQKGLLYQEIKKNNLQAYENFRLQQEVEYLKALLRISRTESESTIKS